MNKLGLIAILGGAALLVASKASGGSEGSSRRLVKGRTYEATFKVPEGSNFTSDVLGHIADLVPPDSAITLAPTGGPIQTVTITFAAQRDSDIGDLQTPVGTFKLVSVRAV